MVVGPLCTSTSVTSAASGCPGDIDLTPFQSEYIIPLSVVWFWKQSPIAMSGWVGLDSWLDEEEYGTCVESSSWNELEPYILNKNQTWDLSKKLHDQIFRPEILHTKKA